VNTGSVWAFGGGRKRGGTQWALIRILMSGKQRVPELEEEIESLRSIFYGEGEFVVTGGGGVVLKEGEIQRYILNNSSGVIKVSVHLTHKVECAGTLYTVVELSLNSSYLLESIPIIELKNPILSSNFLEQLRESASLVAVPGYPCLYEIIQHINDGLSHIKQSDLACEQDRDGKSGSTLPPGWHWQANDIIER